MEWLADNWVDLIQTAGIVVSGLFTVHTIRRDEKSRRISNLLNITQQYRETWKMLYERPSLVRVLSKDVDLEREPVSEEERRFVMLLVFHLDAAYEAMRARMFVRLEGLKKDTKQFFSLPIPNAVWKTIKPLQNRRLVEFVETA